MVKRLYETDYNLWIQSTKEKLTKRDFNTVDWDNLIEEIDDMGKSQKRSLRSYYFRLVEHILKLRDWDAEKERNAPKWRVEVSNFRREINCILEDSPSLKNHLEQNHAIWFAKIIKTYSESEPFIVKDSTVIPLEKMMSEDYFG